jgi:hypothetical protein
MDESKLTTLFKRINTTANLIVSIQKFLSVNEDKAVTNLGDLMNEIESEVKICKKETIGNGILDTKKF